MENENTSFITDELPEEVEIIGISFRGSTKIYYFAANGHIAKDGDNAIVETARGMEYGGVALTNTFVKRETLVLPLKNILRIADKNDDLRYEANKEKEKEAFDICLKKIAEHKLDMKLIDVEYTFDNSKLLFYFTSDDRVDFRELVKDLASLFKTRIELRQIGIRDEAKIMGGLGICGRPFCCNTFLPDFVQVSIKMAKDQNLSLNSAKISGACGRLMCCLRYENDVYQEEIRKMPKVDSTVVTPDGIGMVTEIKPLENNVKVVLNADGDKQGKIYHLSVLKPYDKNSAEQLEKSEAVTEKSIEAISSSSKKRIDKSSKASERIETNKHHSSAAKNIEKTHSDGTDTNYETKKQHNKGYRQSKKEFREPKVSIPTENGNELNKHEGGANNEARHDNRSAQRNNRNKKQYNNNRSSNNENKENVTQTHEVPKTDAAPNEEKGRAKYAPMPSNQIKKGNRFKGKK